MTSIDDAIFAALALMAFIGMPYILATAPTVIQGDWRMAHILIQQGWPLLGFSTIVLMCLIMIAGAVLE